MAKVVVSLGGSLVCGRDDYVKQAAALFVELSKKHSLVVVVGGGSKARKYADRERRKGEFFADRAAIKATRENAELVRKALGSKASSKVVSNVDEAADALSAGKIPVSGGLLEGLTTDAVSVLIAERIGADRLVNASNVAGVYDSDPKKNKNAKKFGTLNHDKLVSLAVKNDERKARTHFVFDLIACKLAARSNLELHFVDGNAFGELEKAINGKKHCGTVARD